jgi:universal stress protein A
MTIKKILVGTDVSEGAGLALEWARSLGQQLGAKIHLLNVVEDPYIAAAWSEAYMLDVPALGRQLLAHARERLSAIVQTDPAMIVSEAVPGRPVDAIVEKAEALGVDLIVLGSHGRSGFTRMMMGSVAERVVRTATCPVVVIHGQPKDTPAKAATIVKSPVGV